MGDQAGQGDAPAPKLRWSIDPGAGVVTIRYLADPSFEEWASTMETVFKAPAYRAGLALLLDRRGVGAPSSDYIQRVVRFVERHRRELAGSRVAVVVGDPAAYGMARMAGTLMGKSDESQRTFLDVEEALRWLRAAGTEGT